MIYRNVVKVADTHIIPLVLELYALKNHEIKQIPPHDGRRNLIYTCEKKSGSAKIIRISFLDDRTREDYLAELEYVRYLSEYGGSVANVISSSGGNLLEEITHNGHTFYVSVFEKAKGKMLVENHYRYRDGVPITEYYFNCGKVLGKLHQLSKEYTPVHRRYSFFDKFNYEYIDKLIPDSLYNLKNKLKEILKALKKLTEDRETFGMIHFDYNDGNYHIDFDDGQITVFDFDNSCYGWYMYDLANLWTHGVGWIQFEQDADKRKAFMEDYFRVILEGYRSETKVNDSMLKKLPLFIQAVTMENIVDAFEVMRDNDEELECDEELSYLIKCIEDDIPYKGFFHEFYRAEKPFEHTPRNI